MNRNFVNAHIYVSLMKVIKFFGKSNKTLKIKISKNLTKKSNYLKKLFLTLNLSNYKILILGASGLLGSELYYYLNKHNFKCYGSYFKTKKKINKN